MHDVGSLVPVTQKDTPPVFEVGEDATKFFLDLKDKCQKLNEAEWLAIKRQMIRARNYFDGRQYGDVNDACQWVDYPKKAGEISYTVNAYQAHIQTALTEISKGNVDLSFSHIAPDSRHGQMIARIAESRYKTHRRRLCNTTKLQHERLSFLLNGVAARYTYFCESGRKEKIPMMGETDVQGESISACAECSAPSDGECPKCGSTEVMEITAPGYKAKAIIGYSEQAGGENDYDTPDPLGLIWYLHAENVSKTPFIGWKQIVLEDVLRAKFPEANVVTGIKSVELNYQAGIKTSTPQTLTTLDSGDKSTCEYEQWWFDPSLYGLYKLKADVKLRNGSVIPAGTPLGKAFPKGLYLAINGNKLLDVWSESKNDKWTIAPYVTRIGTMVGAGTSAALQDQDTLNDLRNLQMASIMNDSFPKEFVNSQFIEPENIPNDPTERAVVTNWSAGTQGNSMVGAVIDRLPPAPLSADAYAMTETLHGQMQMVLGTFSGTQSGMPDLKAVQDTAAGMQMWREMTVGRFYPMLSVIADQIDRMQAYQLLENDQKYYTPQQWQKVKGDYDSESLKAFLNCNLRDELIIEVSDNSFMPLSQSQQQANALGYSKFFVETQGALGDEMNAHVAGLFGIPKSIIGRDAQAQTAYTDIGLFKEQADAVVEEFGDIPTFDINDPIAGSVAQLVVSEANCPISFEMDDLTAYADTLRDFYQTDGGREASNVLKAAIHFRMMEIDQAMVLKTQKDLTLQMASQQPAMQAQAQMAEQQAAAEGKNAEAQAQADAEAAEREAENKETDLMARGAEKVMDAEQNDVARQHEKEMAMMQSEEAEKQRAHDLAMKDKEIQAAKKPAK